MKNLLTKLEELVNLKLIDLESSRSIYAGSFSYDTSGSNDSSTTYDQSIIYDASNGATDTCIEHDQPR